MFGFNFRDDQIFKHVEHKIAKQIPRSNVTFNEFLYGLKVGTVSGINQLFLDDNNRPTKGLPHLYSFFATMSLTVYNDANVGTNIDVKFRLDKGMQGGQVLDRFTVITVNNLDVNDLRQFINVRYSYYAKILPFIGIAIHSYLVGLVEKHSYSKWEFVKKLFPSDFIPNATSLAAQAIIQKSFRSMQANELEDSDRKNTAKGLQNELSTIKLPNADGLTHHDILLDGAFRISYT